jgi:hypothetical protein
MFKASPRQSRLPLKGGSPNDNRDRPLSRKKLRVALFLPVARHGGTHTVLRLCTSIRVAKHELFRTFHAFVGELNFVAQKGVP